MKTYKLNLNKFGIFILTAGSFVLWAWIFKEILAGLAGM